jgi:hypothetical protein
MLDSVFKKMELVEQMIRDGKVPTQDLLNTVLVSLGKIMTLLLLDQGYSEELRTLFQRYLRLCNLRLESTGTGSSHWIW